MSRIPKVFVHNTTVEITTRMQQGLPMVCSPYMKDIIEGVLAAAAYHHPVTICHYLFMANHFHMLIVVRDPVDVPGFVGYLKEEITQAINRLHGFESRTLWKEGYDSPTILDASKVLDRIDHLYQNPVKAGLTETLAEYPGFNSYGAFITGKSTKLCKKITRDRIPVLPEEALGINEQKRFAAELQKGPGQKYKLEVEPFAWVKCVRKPLNKTNQEIFTEFLDRQEQAEERYRMERNGKPVLGVSALRRQDSRQQYHSTPQGKKTWCLSSYSELRKDYISFMKGKLREQRANYNKWKAGDLRSLPPPGFFAPGGMLFSYLVPFMLPFFA